jgi:4-hydroxybenzoate polyprenyltransferase
MNAAALTLTDPFARRLWAYLLERFHPISNMLLIVSYYSSNQFLAQLLTHPGQPVSYSIRSLAGAVTVLCMFFHLRVFDEHKDFEDDGRHFPDRVLQRGLITLRDLKFLGAAALSVEVILGALLGPAALTAVLIAIGFSVLMLKEFFCGSWLKRHFLLYATSHMLIMPLFALVVFSATTGRYPWQAPFWFFFYAFVGFFVTFNWEVSRKIRAPEDEIPGVDSYTRIFGTYGAAYAVLLIRLVDTAMVALVGSVLGAASWFFAALIALFAVCLVGFFDYRFRTNSRTAKRMEVYAGMYIVAFDLILAVEILRIQGARWL